jgi:predicted secreted protein
MLTLMTSLCLTGCAPASTDIMGTITMPSKPAVSAGTDSEVNNDMLMIGKQDNGKEITAKRGDIIQIELERSGGTGYEWYLDQDYKEYFELLKEDQKELSREGFVGTPVITRWQLKAVKQGDAELKLFLYRNWEDKDKAASLFKIKVKIN